MMDLKSYIIKLNLIELTLENIHVIKENGNIYFANILEYWFAGGSNIDYPEIRIFDLYEPEPWRDSDLGISPDMKYAKENCTFYKPYYIRE